MARPKKAVAAPKKAAPAPKPMTPSLPRPPGRVGMVEARLPTKMPREPIVAGKPVYPPETTPPPAPPPPAPVRSAQKEVLAALKVAFAGIDDGDYWAERALLSLGDEARARCSMPSNVATVLLGLATQTEADIDARQKR